MGFFKKKGKSGDKGKEPELHQTHQDVFMVPVQTSQTYQDILNERKSLLCERRVLLADQSFINLNEQKQIEYCRLNKSLMENYWHGFETLKEDAFFEAAAQDFQEALYMGYGKARELLKAMQSIHSNATEENDFFSEDTGSFTKGLCYHLGLGRQQNHHNAFQYYQEAAGQGDARAQLNLGYCYRHGLGTAKNEGEAVRLYTLAAEQGCASAQNNLGICYQYGIGTAKNEGEAVRLYTLAAEQGDARAQLNLGYCYHQGIGTEKNEGEAVRLYTLATEQVDASTQNNLGYCYQYGIGTAKNEGEAVRLYTLAAEQGDARAQLNLGYCYHQGIGTEKNEGEAVRLYTLATEQVDASTQNNLGYCYQYGIGTAKNEGEAVRLYTLAAEQGDARAQLNLGYCYHQGIGTAKNEKEAVRLYTLAAEQGDASAQLNLGYCYHQGIGTEKNEKEAVRLYALAATQGNAGALHNLKTIKTPLANYKLALIEKNYQQMTELAINHDELREVFFKDDFIVIAQGFKNIQNASDLLAFLNESAQKANKNINNLLITTLLQLKNAEPESLPENIEVLNYLLTELLSLVSLADAEAEQVKDLMHFLINHFDENYQESFIDNLRKLWHRAQALEVQLDNAALNRLIADKVIHCLFKGEYCLVFNEQLDSLDLGLILLAYKKQPRVTVEELNRRLSEPLLVKTNHHLKNLLPRLKACLLNHNAWDGDISPSLSELVVRLKEKIKDGAPLDEETTDLLAQELKKYAQGIKATSTLPFFNHPIHSKELELANILIDGEKLKLLAWIVENEQPLNQNVSPESSMHGIPGSY
jgi:TPR repeat protein